MSKLYNLADWNIVYTSSDASFLLY